MAIWDGDCCPMPPRVTDKTWAKTKVNISWFKDNVLSHHVESLWTMKRLFQKPIEMMQSTRLKGTRKWHTCGITCLKGKMTFLSENSHHSLNLLQGKLHRTSYCCNSLSYFPCPLPASGPRPGALHDIINSLTSSKQQIPCPSLQKLKMEIR